MENYSVLMSVYHKDKPDWLYKSAISMIEQSYKPSQFVLVADGPLNDELNKTIQSISNKCADIISFKLVEIEECGGLGPALNTGLKYCTYDLVARMDADDISLFKRCEMQVSYMTAHPKCGALSGTIIEFEGDVPKDVNSCVKKFVPLTELAIKKYAPLRNPINHPCVMFRKSFVEKAGGYQNVSYFEDYDLWLRMIFDHNMSLANLPDSLLLMRTDGMYQRRGGKTYAKSILSFRKKMSEKGYISIWKNLPITATRVIISLLPGDTRKLIYKRLLR